VCSHVLILASFAGAVSYAVCPILAWEVLERQGRWPTFSTDLHFHVVVVTNRPIIVCREAYAPAGPCETREPTRKSSVAPAVGNR
jgi:hypothetical protein